MAVGKQKKVIKKKGGKKKTYVKHCSFVYHVVPRMAPDDQHTRQNVVMMCLPWFGARLVWLSRSADAFARKDWYDIRTPSYFETRTAGKTPVSRTQGTSKCVVATGHDSASLVSRPVAVW
jgi:hypothetical protein